MPCPGGLAGTAAPLLPCPLAPTFPVHELSCCTEEAKPGRCARVSLAGVGGRRLCAAITQGVWGSGGSCGAASSALGVVLEFCALGWLSQAPTRGPCLSPVPITAVRHTSYTETAHTHAYMCARLEHRIGVRSYPHQVYTLLQVRFF